MLFYIKDSKFLLGLGVGLVISSMLLFYYAPRNIPKYKIEIMARQMGMMYPDEIKAYFNNEK